MLFCVFADTVDECSRPLWVVDEHRNAKKVRRKTRWPVFSISSGIEISNTNPSRLVTELARKKDIVREKLEKVLANVVNVSGKLGDFLIRKVDFPQLEPIRLSITMHDSLNSRGSVLTPSVLTSKQIRHRLDSYGFLPTPEQILKHIKNPDLVKEAKNTLCIYDIINS